jgi:Reverse transcriptase (RNA-dependent DNA polymerase)/RNase H-like domain found in reverse transcriptase/Ty3 transposon capsid-like protein/Integrase zinc binding domain
MSSPNSEFSATNESDQLGNQSGPRFLGSQSPRPDDASRSALIQSYLLLSQKVNLPSLRACICLPPEALERLTRPLLLDASDRLATFLAANSFLNSHSDDNASIAPFPSSANKIPPRTHFAEDVNNLIPKPLPAMFSPLVRPLPSTRPLELKDNHQMGPAESTGIPTAFPLPQPGTTPFLPQLQPVPPERFGGEPADFTTFVMSVNAILCLYPTLSNAGRINYVRALLKGDAAAWVASYSGPSDDFDAFMHDFSEVFSDPLSLSDAISSLRNLRDLGDIDVYNSSFLRLQLRAQLPPALALRLYLDGLQVSLQRELLNFNLDLGLSVAMSTARHLHAPLRRLETSKSSTSRHSAATTSLPIDAFAPQVFWPYPPADNPNYTLPSATVPLVDNLGNSSAPTKLPYMIQGPNSSNQSAAVQSSASHHSSKPTPKRSRGTVVSAAVSSSGMPPKCWLCNTVGHRYQECSKKQLFLEFLSSQSSGGSTSHSVLPRITQPTQHHASVVGFCSSTVPSVSDFYLRPFVPAVLLAPPLPPRDIIALVDTGADCNMINASLLPPQTIVSPTASTLLDALHRPIPSSMAPPSTDILVGHFSSALPSVSVANLGYDAILGAPWCARHKAHFDWEHHLLRIYASASSAILPFKILQGGPGLASVQSSSVPPLLNEFSPLFATSPVGGLPPHRMGLDCSIILRDPSILPAPARMYPMSDGDLVDLRTYITEMLSLGFIRPSASPVAAPAFYVPKADGSRRLCIDYRKFNASILPDRYPIPLVSDLVDRFRSARVFTKLDLRSAYHQLRIRDGDEWLTAFRCRYGLFEYLVMPFGLAHAPACFQRFIHAVLNEFLDLGVVVYLDDILVYSDNMEDHVILLRKVLTALRAHNLIIKLSKCSFFQSQIDFLGVVFSAEGSALSPTKRNVILDWPVPSSLLDLQRFLGFTNFCRRFIPQYSQLMFPLHQLLRGKPSSFSWSSELTSIFQDIKSKFLSTVILPHPDPKLPFELAVDASDYALGAILRQRGRPVGFHSRSLRVHELNYSTIEKELLALISALTTWEHFLLSSKFPISVLTDHRNLLALTKFNISNSRHARWFEFLSRFPMDIKFIPGIRNGQADFLSRPPSNTRSSVLVPSQTLFKPSSFSAAATRFVSFPENVKQLLVRCHDHPLAGHRGRDQTFRLLKANGFLGSRQLSDDYVDSCFTCLSTKPFRQLPYGLLQPLIPPSTPATNWTVDILSGLPTNISGFRYIIVFVDRFSKFSRFSCIKNLLRLLFFFDMLIR